MKGSRRDTLIVFTGEGAAQIIASGRSDAWKLSVDRAEQCRWLVCVQNRNTKDSERRPTAAHGSAFLRAQISGFKAHEDRWSILIGAPETIDIPNFWDGARNPVRYTLLAELPGIAPEPPPTKN